jgi:putative membrane protein
MKATIALALAALLGSATIALAASNASQRFIKEAITGNLAEIQMGQLAEQKGQSEAVKSYGQMLVADHSEANQKAVALADQMGVTPPSEPTAKQKGMYDKLAKLSGPEFDHAFAREMVADHKNDIREFKKEAAKKGDPTAEFAAENLPTLQKHLDAAQKLTTSDRSRR